MSLDRERITEAAVELLDEVGLAGLSTRRLATKTWIRRSAPTRRPREDANAGR